MPLTCVIWFWKTKVLEKVVMEYKLCGDVEVTLLVRPEIVFSQSVIVNGIVHSGNVCYLIQSINHHDCTF